MSSILAGDFIFLHSEPQAIWDENNNGFRFYYRYRAFVPVENFLRVRDDSAADRDVVVADIWVAAPSPTAPFKDLSVVDLRGRIVSPTVYDSTTTESSNSTSESNSNSDSDSFVTIHVEAVFAHFRRQVTEDEWVLVLMNECVRPQCHIIAKVVDYEQSVEKGPISLLLESKDEVSDGVETLRIG